jgi:hypothetical protein
MHMLDGMHGRDSGVLILRDGRFLGGGPYFWSTGSYTCRDGTWKVSVVFRPRLEGLALGRPTAAVDRCRCWDDR